jgi:hypothetical protein
MHRQLHIQLKYRKKSHSPNPIASTSIGSEPRRFVSNASESVRRVSDQSFLNLYQGVLPLTLLLDVDSIPSLMIGVKISMAPLEDRRRKIFFGLRRFPLTLPRSHGTEPLR